LYNDGVFILIDDDDIPFYSFIPGTSILIKYTIEFEEVVIRTNSIYTKLTINAPQHDIKHVGLVGDVIIEAVASTSYVEKGKVNGYISLQQGNLVLSPAAEVFAVVVEPVAGATVSVDFQQGASLEMIATTVKLAPAMVAKLPTNLREAAETPVTVTEELEQIKIGASLFAGGKGTADKPYLIGTAQHWNNFYQRVYDWEGDTIPYFELTDDIDLTNIHIKNYAMDDGEKVAYFDMWFDLNGNNHTVKGITYLDGYCQVFPYILDANIHDITIDYNLDETRTAAMVYSPTGDNYFTNVTTTGSIATTANWATAYVAYMYKEPDYNSNVTYTNVVNYANIKGSYGNNGYTAVFGSHNGGGGHITFDNCKNYGVLLGGHVGFVGMGSDDAYTFVDSNAVKNYGSMAGTKSVGYFNNSGDATSKTIGDVTCEVKQASASKSMSTTHTNTAPANFGDVIAINEVEGASKYEVQMSISIGMYNYNNGNLKNKWGGGFPRSMTFVYTEDDVKDGKIATDLIKGYFGEIKEGQYYGHGDTMPTYSGMFLPDGFDLKSNDVTILGNQGDLYLVEYEENQFYVLYSEDYPGCYTLLSTNDAGEITTKNLTVSFSVTAYNPNGSVLSCSSFSYTASVDDAISFFNGLGNNLNE